MESKKKLAILLQHATYENFNLAATLAATQAALAGEVHIFLAHEALFFYVRGDMEKMPSGFESTEYRHIYEKLRRKEETEKISNPVSLLNQAKSLGPVHIYGCSETAKLLKISPDETKKLQALIGYSTFLNLASDAQFIVI